MKEEDMKDYQRIPQFTRRDFLRYTGLAGAAALPLLHWSRLPAFGTSKILKVGVSSDAWNLDVRLSTDVTGINVGLNVFNGLMNYDPDGKMFPDLAEDFPEVPDDKTYIFHLRKGVEFQKGFGELTAEDVVYTYESILGKAGNITSRIAIWFRPIDSIEAVDKYTVKFNMKSPFPDFPDMSSIAKIVSKKADQQLKKEFDRNPVGTGPFEVVEWVKDDHITLRKFSKHFRKDIPKVDELIIQVIPDDTVKVTNLITGQVDMIKEIPPRNLEQLKSLPNIVVGQRTRTQTEQMYFNTAKPPFDNVNLRRAVAHAINRKVIAEQVFLGMAQEAYAPVPEWQMPYPDGMTMNKYNLDKAKEFLKAAGKPDGFAFTCITTNQGWFVEQLTVIQADLAKIGIKMNIEPMEKSAMFANMRKGEYQASYEDLNPAYFGYSPATPVLFYTPPDRALFWNDEPAQKADKLLQEFRATMDKEKRTQIYGEFLKIVADQVPYVQVVFVDSTDAWRKGVTGYEVSIPNNSIWWYTDITA